MVWDRDHANQLYSTGFYGRPIGDPRPRKGVDPPLVLDLIEAYYLAQRRALRVLQGGRELTAPEVAEAARGFQGFQEKSRVYKELRDKGYVVTFKKTDPLFVFDLSDPHKPAIAGELKIPGFSTYMHRLDDDHLLTIGYDADDQGRFAWFQGIML